MKTIDGLPPLTDENGEARELTDADFARARPWQPGDPVGRPRATSAADALRTAAEDLSASKRELGPQKK